MRKFLPLIVIVILIAGYIQNGNNAFFNFSDPAQSDQIHTAKADKNHYIPSQDNGTSVQQAYKNQQSNVQIKGTGKVLKILADDLDGSRHQRFILKLSSGQTVLVAHNIDLAKKIQPLSKGDSVEFYGEYEWNSKGGVIHWTHHDPSGRHIDGWLKHNAKTYQ